MDLQSYIQLKEAYSQVGKPQQVQLTEEEVWVEVEAFAASLVENHDFDLSGHAWDEILEAYSESSEELLEFIKWGGNGGGAQPDAAAIAAGKKREAERRAAISKKSKEERAAKNSAPASKDEYAGGVAGQFQRLGDKLSGNKNRATKARDYETSVNNIRTRKTNDGTGSRNSPISQNDVAAETGGRKKQLAAKAAETKDPEKKTPLEKKPVEKTPVEKTTQKTTQQAASPAATGGASDPRNKEYVAARTKANAKGATAADQAAAKKTGMDAWAKANPKLAAAKAKRDSTRGTSATDNPLMKDFKNRMPKPVAPAKATPAKSLTGNKASSFTSSGGAKAAAAKSTPTPAPVKATPAAVKPTPTKRPLTSAAPPKTGAAATSALDKFTKPKPKPTSTKAAPGRDLGFGSANEEFDVFDTILAHLIEQGFGDDEALILMTSMSEEKRQQMLATIFEEESDSMKDKQLENGGHASRSDYNRPTRNPATGDKKKGETPLQKAAKEKYGAGASAMDIVRAKIKAQHGDKAIKDTKKD